MSRLYSRCCTVWLTSRRNRFFVGSLPTPSTGAVPALRYALLVDLGDDIAIAGEERFGRAHFCAQRQLAFRQTVIAVLFKFFLAAVSVRAAGAEGAFIHLAAGTGIANFRILPGAERTRVKSVTAPDAQVL